MAMVANMLKCNRPLLTTATVKRRVFCHASPKHANMKHPIHWKPLLFVCHPCLITKGLRTKRTMFCNQVAACNLPNDLIASSSATVPPWHISPAHVWGPDLVLLGFRVDLEFQGIQHGRTVRALREIPRFREGRRDRVVRRSCYGNRTGSGWASCWFCSSGLQETTPQGEGMFSGDLNFRFTIAHFRCIYGWLQSMHLDWLLKRKELRDLNGKKGSLDNWNLYLLFTSCSQTCLAMERIMFWEAKSP